AEDGIARLKAKELAYGGFKEQRDDAQAEVKGLADAIRAAIKALDAAIAQAAKAIGAAPFAAAQALAARLTDIEGVFATKLASAIDAAELKLDSTRTALAELGKAVAAANTPAAIDATLKGQAQKVAAGSSDKFGPFFEALQAECEQLALLGQSPNGDAIGEAERGLAELQARIKKFTPGGGTQGGATLDAVTERLSRSEKALKAINDT